MGFVGLDPATNAFAPDKLRAEAIRSQALENAAVDTAQGHMGAADITGRAATDAADITGAANRYGADKSAEAHKYEADKRLQGLSVPTTTIHYGLDENRSLAMGGKVTADRRPYLVGERGPELMVPEQNGTIIPNHKLQLLAHRGEAIPRADGGPVTPTGGAFPTGGGDPVTNFKNYVDTSRPGFLQAKKDLMAASAKYDPTGAKTYHQALALAPQRAENDAIATQNANDFNQYYLANTGAAALPKVGEPGFPDYHGAVEVAKRFGSEPARAFHNDTQKVNQYRPLFTPENVSAYTGVAPDKAAGFMGELAKNPAAERAYLLQHGPALQKQTGNVTPVSNQTTGGQLESIGRAITPNWMRPPEWGPAQ